MLQEATEEGKRTILQNQTQIQFRSEMRFRGIASFLRISRFQWRESFVSDRTRAPFVYASRTIHENAHPPRQIPVTPPVSRP
jgi:hypothetical protein